MKHPCLLCLILVTAPAVARADDCPAAPPAGLAERRALAKKWFASAEQAERDKDEVSALRAYQCSMQLVPHAFTSYNLARAAEETGDLELALDAYRTYLTMKPDAEDGAEVSAHVQALEQKIAVVRAARTSAASDPAPAPPVPAPAAPPVAPLAPTADVGPAVDRAAGLQLRTADWVLGSAAAASLVTGAAFNLVARSKMNDCRALSDADQVADALHACASAKPLAYTSYGLLGAGGAAAAVDLALVLTRSRSEHLVVKPMSSGAVIALRGRFW